MSAPDKDTILTRIEQGVICVREGPSANCSSIGSVVDTLFLTAVAGGALFTAVAAAIAAEKDDVRVVGAETSPPEEEEKSDAPAP
jgi:hypothetical protein